MGKVAAMSRRLDAMYRRAFERAFLEYRSNGASEEVALALAEQDAQEQQDRYVDDKIEEQKLRKRGIEP